MLLLFWRVPPTIVLAETAGATAASAPAIFHAGATLQPSPSTAVATAQVARPRFGFPVETATAGAYASPLIVVITQEAHLTVSRPTLGAYGQAADFLGRAAIVLGPVLDGTGTSSYLGHAFIVLPAPTLDGFGAAPLDGAVRLVISRPSLNASGDSLPYRGPGGITIGAPSITTAAALMFSGAGTVSPAPIVIAGMAPAVTAPIIVPLVPTDVHVVEAFDLNGVLLGRVQPISRAKFTMVENDIGDFEIELPWIYDDIINMLQGRNRIEYSIKGIRVFGGIIMKRVFHQEGRYSIVTLSGPSYNGILSRRVLVPPSGADDDVYTGLHADDLMKAIARRQFGSLAIPARQAPGITIQADTSQSSFITNYNGRYETVLEAYQNITKLVTDTKFRVIRGADGLLQFCTYVPIIGHEHGIGQAATVLFDMGGGNALNVEYVEDGTSLHNYIYGGGPGDGAARMIREGFNAESIADWGRIESFLDSSGVKTTDELDLEILKELDQSSRGGPSLTFTIGQAGRYEYPVDFQFGDRVSAIWKEAGLTLTDVISGITINLEENGTMTIEMSIGVPNLFRLSPGRALARSIRAMRGDVGLMQRH